MSKLFVSMIAAALFAGTAYAQLMPDFDSIDLSQFGYEELVAVTMTPENPRPNDTVYISVRSTTSDLGRSSIAWAVNGKIWKEGTGALDFELKAGKLGERTVVEMIAVTPERKKIVETITIVPTDVDLIWQADTMTPPFYDGKTMYTGHSDLEVVAIPHILAGGKEIDPGELVYDWKSAGVPQGDKSGYGRNVFQVPQNLLRKPTVIEVSVSSIDNKYKAYRKMQVQPIQPKVLAFEDHPLYGVQTERALLGEVEMSGKEISLMAYPFFFSPNGYGSANLEWRQNREPVSGGMYGDVIFRNEEGRSGKSFIQVRASHPTRAPQMAETQFTLSLVGDDENQ